MKKRKLVITIAIIFIIISIFCIARYIIVNNKNEIQNKENNQTENWDNQYSEVDKNDINYNNTDDVDKLKEQMGLTAPSDVYEISEEFDGRKTLNVKAEILYKTAFVGIVNQEKPEMENLDKVFETKYPTRSGIWISERAREKIVKILSNIEVNIDYPEYTDEVEVTHELLNKYLKELNCSSKKLSTESGLSESVISRYRSGERTPVKESEQMNKLTTALFNISHEYMLDTLKLENKISLIIFNLGYLPNSDKKIKTNYKSTIKAIE